MTEDISHLENTQKLYDEGELSGIIVLPKLDALVSFPCWLLHDRGDPAQLLDWSLADLWVSKQGRLYHDSKTQGRPACLLGGVMASALAARRLAPNEACRDCAVEIGMDPDTPWFPEEEGPMPLPVLIAAQENAGLEAFMEVLAAFKFPPAADGADVGPQEGSPGRPPIKGESKSLCAAHKLLSGGLLRASAPSAPAPEPLDPGGPPVDIGTLSAEIGLSAETLQTQQTEQTEEWQPSLDSATVAALAPEAQKWELAQRRKVQDQLLRKYQGLAKSLEGKRAVGRSIDQQKHTEQADSYRTSTDRALQGAAVFAGVTQKKIAELRQGEKSLSKTGKFRDVLGDEGEDFFEGEFLNGKRHGRGTLQFAGATYEGIWRNDRQEGSGQMQEADGSILKGEWKNGYLHGQGAIVDPQGQELFNGNFKEGRRDGFGRQVFENGDEYAGDWRDGRMHGRGSYSFRNGDRYDGNWDNGAYHGEGVFIFADGSFSRRSYVRGNLEEAQDYRTEVKRFDPIYTRVTMHGHSSDYETPVWAKGMQVPLRV